MKRQRDSTEWNCSTKMVFSPELRECATRFVDKVKKRFSNQPDKYHSFVRVLYDIPAQRIRGNSASKEEAVHRIVEIFQGHDDLIREFKIFLPGSSTSRAVVIVDKDDLDNSNKEFSKIVPFIPAIPSAPTGAMVKEDGEEEVEEEEEKEEEEREETEKEPVHPMERIRKQGLCFCQKVQQRLATEDYLAFLKLFHCYSIEKIDKKNWGEKITKEQLEEGVVSLIREHSDLICEFKLFLNHCENIHEIEQERAERRFKRQKLDEQKKDGDEEKEDDDSVKYVSPSYQQLPKDHQLAAATTGRTKHKSGVLNDGCLANPPKLERGNYERKRNPESLQDLWEEDKCEIEVLLKWIESAIKCKKALKRGIPLNKIKGLRGIQFKRCVERMYGDHSPEIFALVKENHEVAVPVVIARLKQKQKELKKFNEEFKKL